MSRTADPILVSIEGVIGAGKTTLVLALRGALDNMKIEYAIIPEPVKKWEESGALGDFYRDREKDVSTASYIFQSYVYVTRIEEMLRVVAEHPSVRVFITERTPLTDRIFMEIVKDIIRPSLLTMYREWCDTFQQMIPFDLRKAVFVLLKTPLDICMRRIQKRGRTSEQEISIQYQEDLLRGHEALFENKGEISFPRLVQHENVVVINGELAGHEFIEIDSDARRRILDEIMQKIISSLQ